MVEQWTENPCVPGSIPGGTTKLQSLILGTLAQLVEQWTENPCVPGSIPGGTTKQKAEDLSSAFIFYINLSNKKIGYKTDFFVLFSITESII